MHHKNQNKHSTDNFKNPQHEKPIGHLERQYGRTDMPNPQRPQKTSILSKFREKFREKPATAEEIRQLRLNTQREMLKTQMQRAKSSRPSRFSGIGGGGGGRPSYRRSSARGQEDSFLFGGGSSKSGSFLDFGSGPSLDFLTGNSGKPTRGKQQKSGLEELF